MKTLQDRFLAVVWYLYDRLMEPSSWKGLILMFTGGGWKALDGSNKGEMLAQWGMIFVGMLQFFLPQRTQYATDKPEHRRP